MVFDQQFKSAFIAMLLCVVGTSLSAQQFFSTGTGSNNGFPLGSTSSNKVQWIYQPSDFSGASPTPGNIVKVYFRSSTARTNFTYTNLTVKMGYTTATNTVTGAFATGLTTVFSANHTFVGVAAGDWLEIPLTTPFSYNFTQNLIVELSQTAYTPGGVSVVQTTAGGNKRLYGGVASATGTAGTGLVNFGFDIQPAIPNNAGVFDIAEPVNFCTGTFPVKVTVKNNGNNSINNVQVHWTLDGVPQSSINHTTPINVFGGSGGNSAIVTLGNVTFSGSGRTIKAWTHLPNGVVDPHDDDDTLNTFHRSALNGVYTIGGTSPNYPTMAAAINDLTNFGVCGPVTFNIRNGTYTEQGVIGTIAGASATSRVVFKSESNDAANVTVQFLATGTTDNYVLKLDGADYVTIKDLTLKNTGTGSYGRVLEVAGTSSYDSIVNCNLLGVPSTSTSNNLATVFATAITGSNNVFSGNTITNGGMGVYWYGSSGSLPEDNTFVGNTISDFYYYGFYCYYSSNFKLLNNVVSTSSPYSTVYAATVGYSDNALRVEGNKITTNTTGTVYGLRIYYCDGTATNPGIIRNNVININTSGTTYCLYSYYSSYQNYYNNTVRNNTSGATSYAGYFYHTSTAYSDVVARNNIFSTVQNTGYALYVYNPLYVDLDYNLYHSNSSNLVYKGLATATPYPTLASWRAAADMDHNSITYDPGFTSATDLAPNPADSNSWSVNGRGIQVPGNDKDINGNPRATTLAAGVPDLGAYEFVPTVLPPLATATPATPVAGTSQEFTFGETVVATIDWAAFSTVPGTIDVRQYSGTIPPQLTNVSPSSYMYFYTDIDVPSGMYDYTANINYMDPWLGTISSESNMKLVKKLGTGKWFAYNFTSSTTNTTTNVINAPFLIDHGYYSGIDNDIIFIAIINAEKLGICPNGSVTLTANPGTGITYKWLLDGNYIPGANALTYVATAPGNYEVEQTRGAAIITSDITSIAAVNPPQATIIAGASVICIGGSETLSANTGTDLTYQWKLFGTDIPGETGETYEATTAGVYTVEVTNPGCSSVSQPISLNAIPLPMAVISPDTNVILCSKGAVTMNASVPATGLHLGFQWQRNSIDIPGATAPAFVTTSPGSYTVVVSSGSCPSTISPGTHLITGNTPKPIITKKIEGAQLYLSTGTYRSYQWFKDGVPIKGANNFAYVVTQNGDYSVEVSNGFCTGLSEPYNLRSVGIDDLQRIGRLTVHPNPATTTIHITANQAVNATLMAMDGKVVFTGRDVKSIDISQFVEGVYLLRIMDVDGSVLHNERVVKLAD